MKHVLKAFAALFTFSGFLSCSAQKDTKQETLEAFIDRKADSLYTDKKLPGILIGTFNNGEEQYRHFGYADPGKKTAFNPHTLFEAGSITKTFTAFIVTSVLKEKGISESASIIQYLPDSVKQNKALEKISFLSLLNHTSGLPRLPDNIDLASMAPYDQYTHSDLFNYLKTAVPMPDGKSNYSNLGMGLAGVLAERITGKAYAALLEEYILAPFKMLPAQAETAEKSEGYFGDEKVQFWNMAALAPAGGLKCSAAEMLAYLKQMGNPDDTRKQVIDKLLEPTAELGKGMHIGRSWIINETPGKPTIYWHNGGTYGFSTFAAFTKGGRHAVIVVVNRFNSNDVSDGLGFAIMKKMLE